MSVILENLTTSAKDFTGTKGAMDGDKTFWRGGGGVGSHQYTQLADSLKMGTIFQAT